MQVDVTVDIDKPAEIAFDLMADARHEPSWNTRVTATELTTAEPVGPGTSFTTVNRGRRFTAGSPTTTAHAG